MDSVMGRGRQRKDIMGTYRTVNHADRLNLDVSFIYQNNENQLHFQTRKRVYLDGGDKNKQKFSTLF